MAAEPRDESVHFSGPFREVITHLKQGRLAEAALSFCSVVGIQTEDTLHSSGDQDSQACEQLYELLTGADLDSVAWWGNVASAWSTVGINVAARGCITHARNLAVNRNSDWEELRRLAEIDLSKQPGTSPGRDEVSMPGTKIVEDPQIKFDRLWTYFHRDWNPDSPEHETMLGSDPLVSIMAFRSMDNLPLYRWIWFWNDHGQPGVAIDHFFIAMTGSWYDQLFLGDNFWSLRHLADSFQDSRDPVSAYAALLLLSLSLTAGAGPNLTSQQREDRMGQIREKLKDLEWVASDFHSYAATGINFAIGCQMADWFVANKFPGRFLVFVGDRSVGHLAARSPLLKQRLNTMVHNGGWVRQFIPELDEMLEEGFYLPPAVAPFPHALPAFTASESKAKRRSRSNLASWTIRRPRIDVSQPQSDGSIELNIGLQNDSSINALKVRFGQHNPLAIIHSRVRQALPQLISQMIHEGKNVIWIRDAKFDASPASVGVSTWSWMRRSSNEQANFMTSLAWTPTLQETIVELMTSSTYITFRDDIRNCLGGLLSWLATNPAMLRRKAIQSCLVRSMEEIRDNGLELDGPRGLRRLAVLTDTLMHFIDDLCRAVSCELAHYGNSRQAAKLAVFDTDGDGQLNTVSCLLYVGGLIGLLRKRYELDFRINARLRTGQSDLEDEVPTGSLKEQQARLKKLVEEGELEETEPPSIIGGRVADSCIVVSAAPPGAVTNLVNWLSPGSMGAGACLLVALEKFPETPDFLSGFQTFVTGSLSDQERNRLRISANVALPSITDESPAAVVTVAPQLGGLTISSGLLWPQDDRRI